MIHFSYSGQFATLNSKYISRRFVLSDNYRGAKEELGFRAREIMRGRAPVSGQLWCDIDFKYKGREPDIDAYIKFILDSMNDIVYQDDKQIRRLTVTKTKGKENLAKISLDTYIY